MDRPIILGNIYNLGAPELGQHVVEAVDPVDLETEVERVFAAAAACGVSFPYIQGFSLAGGGAGNTVRATFQVVSNLGWGLNTAIPAARAHFCAGVARTSADIKRVTEYIFERLNLAYPTDDVFIWDVQIAGSGRDGSYWVGVLWSVGIVGRPTYWQHALPSSGPYAIPTTILLLTIPQSVGGITGTLGFWSIHWSIAVNDVGGAATGVKARLLLDGVTVATEYEQTNAVATDWMCMGGVYLLTQSPAAPVTVAIEVEPGAGNTCNVRDANLLALMAVHSGAES